MEKKKITIIGHIDHGSTTISKAIATLKETHDVEIISSSEELDLSEKERGITISNLAKKSITDSEKKLTLLDAKFTPPPKSGQELRRERRKNKRKF